MRDIDTYLPSTKDNFLRLMIALGDDIRVLIIKLADRLHNIRTLSALPPDKQRLRTEQLEGAPQKPAPKHTLLCILSRRDHEQLLQQLCQEPLRDRGMIFLSRIQACGELTLI